MSKPLAGKKALVVGIANERSLAWAIAKKLHDLGAEIAATYLNDAMEKRVRPLAQEVAAPIIAPCDISNPAQIEHLFQTIEKQWGHLDVLIHSIAFANREDLEGRFIDTRREGFLKAIDISAYSLVELARHAEPLMKNQGGSMITLSYYGAEKVIRNYNVMGVAKATLEACVRYLAVDLGKQKIRINAISAGPVKTLAAAGIRDLRTMLAAAEEKSPLGENITAEDVGEMAAFLCGPGGKHVTGSTFYVDSGSHILGA